MNYPQYNQFQQPQIQQPKLQLMNKGFGIDQNEYNTITTSCMNAYAYKQYPMSTTAANNIKRTIGGEWFICSSPVDKKDFDFSLTTAKTEDSLVFSVDNILFQVCRLK